MKEGAPLCLGAETHRWGVSAIFGNVPGEMSSSSYGGRLSYSTEWSSSPFVE